MKIHSHAFKHGLTPDQIIHAFTTSGSERFIRPRDKHLDPPRWALIGFDSAGRPIELVAVELATNDALIIHANYLTKGFLKETQQKGKRL
ncbi:hypothetical protein [Actinotignum urinale]|uniref:Toxin n=1 Tax=Actinotignum urinale TaxID=190146 RepID=A0ABU5G9Q0_9ACTO|nr:hypothetical protein [Actinotignum urinale]MDY5133843.1 hypothetical protein [Actinotignum urinale]